jgi:chloride channel protein, CIC family
MRPAKEVLPAGITVGDALELAASSNFRSWPVCDEAGVIGVLSKEGLERATEQYGKEKQLSELVDARMFPHLHADQSLHLALERMGAAGLDLLPVVSRADVHRLEGIVLRHDVLVSYGIGADVPG